MNTEMSEQFKKAVKKAALALEGTPDSKIFLEEPFDGFFVALEAREEVFATFDPKELIGKGGKEILVFCENLLGRKE